MKFKLDENLPVDLVGVFQSAGHDASSVFEQNLSGEQDNVLLDICRKEKRAFFTLDLDFADVRTYPPVENEGIVVLRLQRQDKDNVEEVTKTTFADIQFRACSTASLDSRRKQDKDPLMTHLSPANEKTLETVRNTYTVTDLAPPDFQIVRTVSNARLERRQTTILFLLNDCEGAFAFGRL